MCFVREFVHPLLHVNTCFRTCVSTGMSSYVYASIRPSVSLSVCRLCIGVPSICILVYYINLNKSITKAEVQISYNK